VEKFVRERLGLGGKMEIKKASLDLKVETDQDKMLRDSLNSSADSKTTTPCKP
jgi:hypothetical protein